MLRLSTSAGRSVVSLRSMAADRSTVSRSDALPGAQDRDQLVEEPLDQGDVALLAGDRDLVAAGVDVGARETLPRRRAGTRHPNPAGSPC